MTSRSATTVLRVLAAGRAVTALGLLARPRLAEELAGLHPAALPSGWIVRLLAGRVLVQSAVQCAHPTRTTALGGAAVDTMHAASMLPVLLGSARYRRSAAATALEATVAAALACLLARHLP